MAEEKKAPLEGWRKLIAGLVAMALGVYLITQGHITEGVGVFIAGLGIVVGGNIYDKKHEKNKK